MQSRALELVVGFFFCLGVAAVFVLTFRVASLNTVSGGEGTYRVTAMFDNIGGLKSGSKVTLSGVSIGRVRDITIDRQTFEARVTVEISKAYNNIPKDSNAKILTAGLLGDQYLGIEAGGDPASLKDGDQIKFTQDALVLENIIGQVLVSKTQESPGAKK